MISRIFNSTYVDHLIHWLMTSGIRVVVIGLGAYMILKLLYILIGRVEKTILKKDEGEFIANLETEKRVKTIGHILREATFVAVFVIALMMILGEVGINIAPMITGAGIIGLAVGFGAQNLVRDVISGIFVLMENQVRVGDVADINGIGGLVEEINLRTIVLRDLEGVVHIFPNGTINTLSNRTRGWSRYVIDLGVAYKENVDNVMKILKEIGEEMSKDEYFGPLMLEPLEILGVDSFGSSEVIIKCMIKTQPLKQWEVGRELRRKIKNTFEQKGIEIPFPHVSVYFGQASKPFALDITDSRNPGASLDYGGYELMKEIAERTGKTPDELLKEALENIRKGEKGSV